MLHCLVAIKKKNGQKHLNKKHPVLWAVSVLTVQEGAIQCAARVGERGCTKVVEEKEVTDRSQEGYSSVKGRVRDRDREREREREPQTE